MKFDYVLSIVLPVPLVLFFCFVSSVMINIRCKIFLKLQNFVDTLSGLEGLIMLVIIILSHMKLDSSVNVVIMIATMDVSFSIGTLGS